MRLRNAGQPRLRPLAWDAEKAKGDVVAQGKTDLVAVLYIVGGMPAIVLVIVLLFIAVRLFGIPA